MKTAEELIKEDYMDSWHHPQQGMDFNLADLDGQTTVSCYNKDRDKNVLFNGQIKSFADYHSKIRRGRIYHNINNMWWVITSEYERFNIASFDLFDDTLRQRISRVLPRIKVTVSVGKK